MKSISGFNFIIYFIKFIKLYKVYNKVQITCFLPQQCFSVYNANKNDCL